MQLTKTMHPPGGATALIANLGSSKILGLGYLYILYPVATGVCILLGVALITNNIPKDRSYPYKQMDPMLFKYNRKNKKTNRL